ncbi:hotdog family protein [Goodfellowiella coeruleoviolacea]|uniref:hypothetical protein n=1 Tax=Goodfellowiella coeruleoviolacea TaxID=334858 RepID=UPI0020A59003|nr:hypothetical protein [Goodfellowiella coeruleoviolacea]
MRATGDPAARNLPLGLVIPLLGELLGGARMWVNYGLNRVRFPGPLPADAFVRLHASVMEVVTKDGAVQVTLDLTVEVQHQAEPACVAEAVFRYYP